MDILGFSAFEACEPARAVLLAARLAYWPVLVHWPFLAWGPFIAAGPIIAALSGGAIGAGVDGLTGALVGLGIPEYEAKRYEGKVKEGGILISVHSESNDETHSAKVIFKEECAHDIYSTGEAHADVQDQADESTTASRFNEISATQEIAAPRVTREKQDAAFVTIEQRKTEK